MKDQIFEFLSKRIFCTISTVNASGRPEAALVGYSQNKNLELVIGTSKLTRKFKNIQFNPNVAVVVADTEGEVQYEGTAKVIEDSEYETLVEGQHLVKLPSVEKYRKDPNQVYIKITPTWLRFIQHSETDQVTEMTEF